MTSRQPEARRFQRHGNGIGRAADDWRSESERLTREAERAADAIARQFVDVLEWRVDGPPDLAPAPDDSDAPPEVLDTGSGAMQRPYRFYSAADLDMLPPPTWLIDGAIPSRGIVGLYGAKGCGKTFALLDLACHIATGLPWHGRTVTPGPAAYILAEGPFGARARIDAWCEFKAYASGLPFNRHELTLWVLPSRCPINEPGAVGALIQELKHLPVLPALIAIDTLNANLNGAEDDRGMNGFANGCIRLRDTFKATVVAAHHTPVADEHRGRGHGAFDGAVDARFILTRDANRLTLECEHQRNAPDGWSVYSELLTIASAGSLALKPIIPTGGKLEGQRRLLLTLVCQHGALDYTGWKRLTDLKKPSFDSARRWLHGRGYVQSDGKKWSPTDAGREALGMSSITRVSQ